MNFLIFLTESLFTRHSLYNLHIHSHNPINSTRLESGWDLLDMTRSELIEKLALIHPDLTAQDIELAVRSIFDRMAGTLAQGGRVEIRGFGSFSLSYRPVRNGRNPKTGASVLVPAKYVPCFKSGKELRERVNNH